MGVKGRKSRYVKCVLNKDREMLCGLSKVGYMNEKMLTQDIGLSRNRIRNYERDGYIKRGVSVNPKDRNGYLVWRLTDKGKRLSARETSVISFYRSSSSNHDLALAEEYLKLNSEEQKNWICESDWRDIYREDNANDYDAEKQSVPDGGYMSSSGDLIAIEVVTASYREADIRSKIEFCKSVGAHYTEVKI